MPKGTPIRAALTGTVYLVRYSTTGYGYHVMIDHGGGFVTLYAHCSKLLVAEGQQVQAGISSLRWVRPGALPVTICISRCGLTAKNKIREAICHNSINLIYPK